ncbi:MAG: NUDIX hydrolase [Ktedonobacteraceae bacterium]
MTQPEPGWQVLATTQVLDTPYLKVRSERVVLPHGVILPDYYIIENRGWVGVVPFTADGRFLINRQYKHGIGEYVLEFPAGGIDEGEDNPLLAAKRELMEESGYSAESDKIELLTEMIANPTSAITRIWWYLARDVRKTGEQKLDPAEEIENALVTPNELLELIHNRQFSVQGQVAAAYIAMEKLGLLKTTF